jgi:hypothetical protein
MTMAATPREIRKLLDRRCRTSEAFEAAWRVFLNSRTEEDFGAWRYDRDLTAWMYVMRDAGLKLPTQTQEGFARCFCGADVNNADVQSHREAARKQLMEFANAIKPVKEGCIFIELLNGPFLYEHRVSQA